MWRRRTLTNDLGLSFPDGMKKEFWYASVALVSYGYLIHVGTTDAARITSIFNAEVFNHGASAFPATGLEENAFQDEFVERTNQYGDLITAIFNGPPEHVPDAAAVFLAEIAEIASNGSADRQVVRPIVKSFLEHCANVCDTLNNISRSGS
jgi:hypothetical protein